MLPSYGISGERRSGLKVSKLVTLFTYAKPIYGFLNSNDSSPYRLRFVHRVVAGILNVPLYSWISSLIGWWANIKEYCGIQLSKKNGSGMRPWHCVLRWIPKCPSPVLGSIIIATSALRHEDQRDEDNKKIVDNVGLIDLSNKRVLMLYFSIINAFIQPQRHRLRWFEHVLRKPDDKLSKQTLPPGSEWSCHHGGLFKTLFDAVKSDVFWESSSAFDVGSSNRSCWIPSRLGCSHYIAMKSSHLVGWHR